MNTVYQPCLLEYEMDTVCHIMGQTSREAGGESVTMSRRVLDHFAPS
jgi:hypothetical protein